MIRRIPLAFSTGVFHTHRLSAGSSDIHHSQEDKGSTVKHQAHSGRFRMRPASKPRPSGNRHGRSGGRARTVVSVLVVALGVCLLFYPFVAQRFSARTEVEQVDRYDAAQRRIGPEKKNGMIERAEAYNRRLLEGRTAATGVLGDDSSENDGDYMGQLSVDGVIGYIEIPKISVDLPIRHGTSSAVLAGGVGHLYGTSLPVGGKGTNSVLAAHRGVPSAVLFTRLDELEKGDCFYIHVLDETLAYKVDAIWTVDPDDVRHYGVTPGRDYVTLLTCTPYGVNTRRLLVRGTRVPLDEATAQSDHGVYPDLYIAVLLVVTVTFIGCGVCAHGAPPAHPRLTHRSPLTAYRTESSLESTSRPFCPFVS